jgi:RNA-binding protein YlmH
MPDASRAKVQSSIKGGLVLVNGKVVACAGDGRPLQ